MNLQVFWLDLLLTFSGFTHVAALSWELQPAHAADLPLRGPLILQEAGADLSRAEATSL